MQKKISIQLSRFLFMILIALFLGAVIWLAIETDLFQAWRGKNDQSAAAAAEQGVLVFYTIDYRDGVEAWIENLCEVSSEEGCAIANTFYRQYMWSSFEENKVRTTIMIQDSALGLELEDQQIWRVGIQPGPVWVGLPVPELGTQDIYIVIEKDSDETWKMLRLLSDTEVNSLLLEVSGE